MTPMRALNTRTQRGITLIGLMFWAIVISMVGLVTLRVVPTINEYYTIRTAVEKVAITGGNTVPEIRAAFDRYKNIEYSITAISGKDLQVRKDNDRVIVSFAYDKEIELFGSVYLLIKYSGSSS
ncbi:conserved hypothetical protein [Leptothrix cholodnii SP-6]|uniref:Transmembrane protein n=1 Tax=Leptothrix cholodnii (strain ATCC 51168 / LMG 8142 / SP-6) TaxID=395495 RepID=B1XZM8_LEPCP|nr:DUF4845 domain-containing protein [Leptothrix cholodnii]ACB32874.1 conserved hypothetical protein [Leptothrix cholodnii SP-6]